MSERRPFHLLPLLVFLLCGPPLIARSLLEDEQEVSSREEFLTRARKLIRDNNYGSKTTPHYKVRTDDPRLDVIATGDLLEEFRTFFVQFWSDRLTLRTDEEPAEVFLFYSQYKYKRLYDDEPGASGIGHYTPYFNIIAIHTDTVGLGDLPDVIIHETAHQLSSRLLFDPESPPSAWIIEGIAEYFGNMRRNSKKGFLPDRVGDKDVSLFTGGPRGTGVRRPLLGEYRSLLKQDELLPLEFFVELTDYTDFQITDQMARYLTSWLLVKYLIDADDGAHMAAFAEYLGKEASGEGGPEAFYAALAVEPDALQEDWNQYVLELKAR